MRDELTGRLRVDERAEAIARRLAAKLAERAYEADKQRILHPETVRDLHESGLSAMDIPTALGGTELNLLTQHRVLELLASSCASTAWCLGNHANACRKLHEVMGDAAEPYLRAVAEEGAIIAQGVVPTGKTVAVEGGFVTSGQWPFLSFSKYARWALLSTNVEGPPPDWEPEEGDVQPPASHNRQLLVDMDAPGLTVLDNWQTMSLRASMSNDATLENVFVPYERAPAMPTARSTFHDTPPGLRLPTGTSFSPPCIVMGIAQAAIRDTITFANQSGMSYGGAARSSTPGNQFAIADAAMAVESARAFFLQELTAVQEKGLRGIPFTARDGIRMRMAGHVVRQNSQMAVERLFVIRGAHGIYESDSFERNYRDVRVGTLPAPSAPDRVREQVGRFLFDPANAGDSRV